MNYRLTNLRAAAILSVLVAGPTAIKKERNVVESGVLSNAIPAAVMAHRVHMIKLARAAGVADAKATRLAMKPGAAISISFDHAARFTEYAKAQGADAFALGMFEFAWQEAFNASPYGKIMGKPAAIVPILPEPAPEPVVEPAAPVASGSMSDASDAAYYPSSEEY